MAHGQRKTALNNYLNQREIYLQNGLKFHQLGRFRKSSELLWGAVTQTIKALAVFSNISIKSHPGFRRYIREVSQEIRDRDLLSDFWLMEDLHKNFYDEEIDESDFETYVELSREYIKKLDDLIKQKTPQ